MAGIVKSAQSITAVFTTAAPTTGAATNADSLPTGVLYVNGTASGATVTVTNITTGRYKAAVTLPSLAAGDVVDIHIAATVGGVVGGGVVWSAVADTKRLSDTLASDVVSISGDSAAADNLEAAADGSGYNLGGGSVVAASVTGSVGGVATGGIAAASIASAAAAKIADVVLRRSWASASASSDGDTLSFRSLLGAVAKLVNKVSVSGSTLTVYKEDDATALGTQTVTADAAAEPIISVDTVG